MEVEIEISATEIELEQPPHPIKKRLLSNSSSDESYVNGTFNFIHNS